MNKNNNVRLLSKTLLDILPYEYNAKLLNNENTIILTKEDSEWTMYISPNELNPDDFTVEVTYNDPLKNHPEQYETFDWTTEDGQIPLDTILNDIKRCL